MNREINSENIFENAYLLLLIDQNDNGLWGKSITIKAKEIDSGPKEIEIFKENKRAESITVTLFAADAIYTYTKNSKNSAIERVLKCLPNYKDNGGYGYKQVISGYLERTEEILINCRHTAAVNLIYLLFEDHIDEKITKSVKFLIDHARKDGGWGVSADFSKNDSECSSTAHVLQLLTIVKEKGIKGTLLENYSSELDSAITNGVDWLKTNNKQNHGFWIYKDLKDKKFEYSAEVLSRFYKLKNYEKELYEETLDKMAALQKDEDGGFPSSKKGDISDLGTTIWIVNALVNSDSDKYRDQIENGITYINKTNSHMKNLTSEKWAMLLKLSNYKNIHISSELDDEIQNLAHTINDKVFKNRDMNVLPKILPKKFHISKEPIISIFDRYMPDILNRNHGCRSDQDFVGCEKDQKVKLESAGMSIDGNKNVSKQVFLSYSSEDKTSVEKICSLLESRGIICWMAPRDVVAGKDFGEQIIEAINSTKIMVIVLSANSNKSKFVKNEVERAFSKGKTVITFKIHEVEPSIALELFIASAQWIAAWNPPLESNVKVLSDTIMEYIDLHEIDERTNKESITQAANQKSFNNSIGMEFVLMPAGEFDMGSPSNEAGRNESEEPVHHVKIGKAFYMGKYEVTQKQWRSIMGKEPSLFKGDELPVESVSWSDVQNFITKLNQKEGENKYRLPTETEWEYAVRAGTTTRYSFGDEESKLDDYAWYGENAGGKSHDVGLKKPNPWGLYDMHGNVWEWVQDEWHNDYNGAPTDGSSWEGNGSLRVIRGGAWNNSIRRCRSAYRNSTVMGTRLDIIGFRLLRNSTALD